MNRIDCCPTSKNHSSKFCEYKNKLKFVLEKFIQLTQKFLNKDYCIEYNYILNLGGWGEKFELNQEHRPHRIPLKFYFLFAVSLNEYNPNILVCIFVVFIFIYLFIFWKEREEVRDPPEMLDFFPLLIRFLIVPYINNKLHYIFQ